MEGDARKMIRTPTNHRRLLDTYVQRTVAPNKEISVYVGSICAELDSVTSRCPKTGHPRWGLTLPLHYVNPLRRAPAINRFKSAGLLSNVRRAAISDAERYLQISDVGMDCAPSSLMVHMRFYQMALSLYSCQYY